ncbi:alpha/beta-hydrolase [Penicillium malachiteum]|uniref:Alpha/beta-hydrolase n=1 Tax=Penicillium malachiteum TaxID=1324776 RepID=A0AAD6HY08_9EURO|nr:alpha/beta-hydrolase [Penicillium malachiteum]
MTSSSVTQDHRVIAMDLPGHGLSDNAPEPENAYTMRGYAECALHILDRLEVREFVVLGWSLGGHIAIEMIPLARVYQKLKMKGMMLIGTPPSSGAEQVTLGFFKKTKSPYMNLASQELFDAQDAYNYAVEATGLPFEEWQQVAALRTDGRARVIMFSAFASGLGVDQVTVIERETEVLISVVNGNEDPFVNLDYTDGLRWGWLQGGRCIRLEGLGHAPFWQDVDRFEPILAKFLRAIVP